MNFFTINNQINFFVPKNKNFIYDTNRNINLLLKTVNGKIFNIKVNLDNFVSEIKNELFKLDKKFNFYNNKIILLYKNKILEDFYYINYYNLENNSIILIIKE